MPEMIGGCLCGKVRFSANADPIFVGLCHCRDCQKRSGGAFSAVIGLPSDALKLQGEMSSYRSTGDSGKSVVHSFCPACGSPIVGEAEVMPGVSMINVGTLDDPTIVKPVMQIYCDSALPWAQVDGLQSFPKMPMPG
jgi:hypothetical protein